MSSDPLARYGFTLEQRAALYRRCPEPVTVALAERQTASVTTVPVSPAAQAVELDPKYRIRPHLKYLSDRLSAAVKDVEDGRDRWMRISTPPRTGKSHLMSVFTPAWILRKHSDWKIGLLSHSPDLAASWGRQIRHLVETHPELGIELSKDAGAAAAWETTDRGSVISKSIPGQSVTGYGFKVLLVDDPVKDFASAHSEKQREVLWEAWQSNIRSRLEPPSLTVFIGCLTADALVLMADGTQRRIEHVRPGDQVATYEGGKLAASTVANWANQGPDHVYSVNMASGRTVRANGRHPFLTINENGAEVWKRTDELQPGEKILSLPGEHGKASPARPTNATSPSAPRDCVSPATTKLSGQKADTNSLRNRIGALISATATASTRKTSTHCSPNKEASAPSASVSQTIRTPAAEASCSSITVMTATEFAAFSVTTAISSLATVRRPSGFYVPLSIYGLTADSIESITPAGRENVFDIEVDRTHNFVANGLVTHNTRWHEDDILGRLASREYAGNPDDWEVIELPAIAGEDDVIGREPGEPLLSPIVDETPAEALKRWESIRISVGSYNWSALYQQRPAPAEGAIFDTSKLRFWTSDPDRKETDNVRFLLPSTLLGGTWLDSWDMAFKETTTSDWVVGQRWVRVGPDRFLIAQQRGRWGFTKSTDRVRQWRTGEDAPLNPCGHLVHKTVIEDKANGPAVIETVKEEFAGVVAWNPKTSKEARAWAVTPECESGNVYVPHPDDPGNEWVSTLLFPELRDFPNAAHDDQVDAWTMGLLNLRTHQRGTISIPGGRTPAPSRVAAARTTRHRRIS